MSEEDRQQFEEWVLNEYDDDDNIRRDDDGVYHWREMMIGWEWWQAACNRMCKWTVTSKAWRHCPRCGGLIEVEEG